MKELLRIRWSFFMGLLGLLPHALAYLYGIKCLVFGLDPYSLVIGILYNHYGAWFNLSAVLGVGFLLIEVWRMPTFFHKLATKTEGEA